MDQNRYSDRDPASVAKSTPDHWIFFILEGAGLIVLGFFAIGVPAIANANVTGSLGWIFLASGVIGLAITY